MLMMHAFGSIIAYQWNKTFFSMQSFLEMDHNLQIQILRFNLFSNNFDIFLLFSRRQEKKKKKKNNNQRNAAHVVQSNVWRRKKFEWSVFLCGKEWNRIYFFSKFRSIEAQANKLFCILVRPLLAVWLF